MPWLFHSTPKVDPEQVHRLHMACHFGKLDTIQALHQAGLSLSSSDAYGVQAIHISAIQGHLPVMRYLHQQGVPLDITNGNGLQPIHLASSYGHFNMVRWLHANGVPVTAATIKGTQSGGRVGTPPGTQPIHLAAEKRFGSDVGLEIVQWLRRKGVPSETMLSEEVSAEHLHRFHSHIITWLKATQECCTPLHFAVFDSASGPTCDETSDHVVHPSPRDAWSLLRNGADLHVRLHATAASALELALQKAALGGASDGSPASLVIRAAEPWSEATHSLFPHLARARAVELMLLGHLLASRMQLGGTLTDVWVHHVLPYAIDRSIVAAVRDPLLLSAYCPRSTAL